MLKGGGGSASPSLPGPLPRYGSEGGLSYMLCASPAKNVVAICKQKIKVEALEVLGEGGRGVGGALRHLQRVQVRGGLYGG